MLNLKFDFVHIVEKSCHNYMTISFLKLIRNVLENGSLGSVSGKDTGAVFHKKGSHCEKAFVG